MTHTPITLQPADDRKGTVVVRHYPDVRIHTYISPPDGFLVNTHMIEGPEKLVLFDGQLLNTYASRLGKPVEQIIGPGSKSWPPAFRPRAMPHFLP
jgi:hypothetical protein